MRIVLLALFLFAAFHFIRTDLAEGTIPLAGFMGNEKNNCIETQEQTFIPVTLVEGDTIESLFALYPDSHVPFLDRLTSFYALNPHLQKQALIGGETVKLPLSSHDVKTCE